MARQLCPPGEGTNTSGSARCARPTHDQRIKERTTTGRVYCNRGCFLLIYSKDLASVSGVARNSAHVNSGGKGQRPGKGAAERKAAAAEA